MIKNLFDIPRVINFSGGRTSALMTILTYQPGDIVLFCDTKQEHEKTYKFLNDFEAFENIPIHRATYTHKKAPGLEGFEALMFHKTIVPSRGRRICTAELKVMVAKRYLRPLIGMKFEQCIGLRADEQHRIDEFEPTYAQSTVRFPLMENGITKDMVNAFWDTKPYNLEIPAILGNCDACFLKGINALIVLFQHYPELAKPWIAFENRVHQNKINAGLKNTKAQFFKKFTYEQLLKIAESQTTLFPLDKILPAYGCSCTV